MLSYDPEAVVEAAFDLFRLDALDVLAPSGEAYIAKVAQEEGLHPDEVREHLHRDAANMMIQAKRHLRRIAEDEFEGLALAAIQTSVAFLAALVTDRMSDVFQPVVRKDRRKEPIGYLQAVLRNKLSVGAPKATPLRPDTARELLRLEAAGQALFEGVYRNFDEEMLSLVEGRIRTMLTNEKERDAALAVVNRVRRHTLSGSEVQRKKLARRFAADVLELEGSSRTLARKFDAARKPVRRMTRRV